MKVVIDSKKITLSKKLIEGVRNELNIGHKLYAVKMFKDTTGLGLRESKDFIDDFEENIKPKK